MSHDTKVCKILTVLNVDKELYQQTLFLKVVEMKLLNVTAVRKLPATSVALQAIKKNSIKQTRLGYVIFVWLSLKRIDLFFVCVIVVC